MEKQGYEVNELKPMEELTPDDIMYHLTMEIEDYERSASEGPGDDDYAIDVRVFPATRARFFQQIIDVIESQQEEIRRLKELQKQTVKDAVKETYYYTLESLPFNCEGYGVHFTDDV